MLGFGDRTSVHPSAHLCHRFSVNCCKTTKRRYQSATEVLGDLNPFSKRIVPSNLTTRIRTDDDDYETPYFGLICKENLQYASTISYAAQMNLPIFTSITVFAPQTQEWYYLPGKKEVKEIEQTVTAFLIFWRLLRSDRLHISCLANYPLVCLLYTTTPNCNDCENKQFKDFLTHESVKWLLESVDTPHEKG